MENYITLTEAAIKMEISLRRLRTLCETERIEGAVRFGRHWAVPADASKPEDKRIKSGKYIKESAN